MLLPHWAAQVNDPGHSAKTEECTEVAGYNTVRTHPTYVDLHEVIYDMVNGCMMYTERAEMVAVSRGTSRQ